MRTERAVQLLGFASKIVTFAYEFSRALGRLVHDASSRYRSEPSYVLARGSNWRARHRP